MSGTIVATVGGVEYRVVPPFPRFVAGSDGSVWKRTGSTLMPVLSLADNPGGRVHVRTGGNRWNNKDHQVCAGRFVLEAFVGPAPGKGYMVRHIDGDRRNNVITNLEWCHRFVMIKTLHKRTAESGYRSGHKSGGRPRTANARPRKPVLRLMGSKLTVEQAEEIRVRAASGERVLEIAEAFGIYSSHICAVLLGRSWADAGGPLRRPVAPTLRHAKLSIADVLAIRERSAAGEAFDVLAVEYGVHPKSIFNVVDRKTWKHVA